MLRYPKGCLTQYEVNIGYYPNRISRDATLRDGPGEQFRILEQLTEGQRVGRQSVRNPQRSAAPPRRAARDGYAWVYVAKSGRSGWVRKDVLGADPGGFADGPASADFEVGSAPGVRHRPRRRTRPRFTIGRNAGGRRVVKGTDVYVRYAARSTPFAYLDNGDAVELRWRGRHYACVEVVASAHTPDGTRGWVALSALRTP